MNIHLGVLLFFISTFALGETKECISLEQEKKFIAQMEKSLKEYSLNDLNALLTIREYSFKDGALKTIDKIDEYLYLQIGTLLLLDNITPEDVQKISGILHVDSYYPFTWDEEYSLRLKEKIKNKIQSK